MVPLVRLTPRLRVDAESPFDGIDSLVTPYTHPAWCRGPSRRSPTPAPRTPSL